MKQKQYITKVKAENEPEKWQAESKVYNLKEIIGYLKNCTEKPENDEKVYFEIDESGTLTIYTANEHPGWTGGTNFTVVDE